MELDLNARSSKWKQDQARRREQAKQRLRHEQQRKAAAAKAQQEMEALQAQKRRERLEQLARQEEAALEEQRLTGGIKYVAQLRPIPTSGLSDKITLPVSALEQLNPQNALDLGVFTFELSYVDPSSGATHLTHAGVMEFIAPEGTVGVPPKVAASLFGDVVGADGRIQVPEQLHVRFVRLEKGSFARLQPRGEGFGDRQLDIKHLLERSLHGHTTLTEGDTLMVRHGKVTFEVIVVELRPESKVNILNTDLEVALLPSEAVAAAQDEKRKQEEAVALAAAMEKQKEERKQLLKAALAPEPPQEERRQTKLMLRLPGGAQETRRFAHEAMLSAVFAWIEALTGDDPQSFQVAVNYPRRVFTMDQGQQSLSAIGLNSRQEAVFVEKRAMGAKPEEDDEMHVNSSDSANFKAQNMRRFPQEWEEARAEFEAAVDKSLYASESVPVHALEPVMPVVESHDQEQKWAAQLKELEAMGFYNTALNIEVLERYQGRLLRVVNYLSEAATMEHSNAAPDSTVQAPNQ